jgi:hypothetical protein
LARAAQTRQKQRVIGVLGTRVAALVGLGVAAFSACQEPDDRPPRGGCVENCPKTPPVGSGGAGGTGSNLDAGVSDVPADASVTLTGTVQVFAGDDFVNRIPFQAQAEVRGESPSGGEVTSSWDGTNPFQLSGVRFGRDVWVSVLPSLAPEEVMPTLLQVDTTLTDPVTLPLVRGVTLDTIFALLTAPTTRAAGAGQVVLSFVDDTSQPAPIAGVRVQFPGSEVVAYDSDGTFSDAEPERGSGPLGLAVVANVSAVPLPGADHTVTLGGTVSASVKVRVAGDTATYLQVRLEP